MMPAVRALRTEIGTEELCEFRDPPGRPLSHRPGRTPAAGEPRQLAEDSREERGANGADRISAEAIAQVADDQDELLALVVAGAARSRVPAPATQLVCESLGNDGRLQAEQMHRVVQLGEVRPSANRGQQGTAHRGTGPVPPEPADGKRHQLEHSGLALHRCQRLGLEAEQDTALCQRQLLDRLPEHIEMGVDGAEQPMPPDSILLEALLFRELGKPALHDGGEESDPAVAAGLTCAPPV